MTCYLKRVGVALSVLLNVTLGGPSNQTFSAGTGNVRKIASLILCGVLIWS